MIDKNLKRKLKSLRKEIFTPRKFMSMSEWADSYRILPPTASASPGKWHTSRTPYLKEPMDALSDPNIHFVVMKTSSQIGKSEMIICSLAFFSMESRPCLCVQPTENSAYAFSKVRLQPTIDHTPVLNEIFNNNVSLRDNRVLEKSASNGANISLVGCQSANSLASRPISCLCLDEIDRFPLDIKSTGGKEGEGDPISLAIQRTATYWNRKILMTSTPTIKGFSLIDEHFDSGSQGFYNIKCCHCGEYFSPRWIHVVWSKSKKGEHLPQTARLVCPHCQHALSEGERIRSIGKGKYIHAFPNRLKKSFYVNAIMSPFVKLSELVDRWLLSQNQTALKAFTNLIMGESFEELTAGVHHKNFLIRRENYTPQTLPNEISFVTAGVDCQGDRLEAVVVGWAPAEEAYIIERQIIHGDPGVAETWERLKQILLKTYQRNDGLILRILAVAIDSGFQTEMVYRFASVNTQRRWYAIKGASTSVPIWPLRASRSKTKEIGKFYLCGVNAAKETVYSWLNNERPGSGGYIHFNMSQDDDFFEQLTSERIKTVYRNGYPTRQFFRPKYAPPGEVLDCVCYALAANRSLNMTPERAQKLNTKYLESQAKQEQESKPEKPVNEEEKSKLINTNIEPKIPEAPKTKPKRKRSRVAHSSGYLAGLV